MIEIITLELKATSSKLVPDHENTFYKRDLRGIYILYDTERIFTSEPHDHNFCFGESHTHHVLIHARKWLHLSMIDGTEEMSQWRSFIRLPWAQGSMVLKPGRETTDWKETEKLPPRCLYHFKLPQRIEVARFFIWNTRSCWGGCLPPSIWSPSTHGFQSYSSLMEGHIRGQSLCDFWLAPLID